MSPRTEAKPRIPLSRDRVLRAAVRIADEGGIEALTMRRLADELDAEAMSLYYHVANKEEVLDGIVEVVVDEINTVVDGLDVSADGADWKAAMRTRILAARKVMLRHPWAPRVMETRNTANPTVLRYFDSLVRLMRAGGFSYDLAHNALHTLGSRALGFTQELFDPGSGPPGDEETAAMMEEFAGRLPHLVGAGHVVAALLTSPFVSQRMVTADVVQCAQNKQNLTTLADLIERGEVSPVIDRTFSFDQVPDAVTYSEKGRARGKVVVTMGT